MKSLNIWYIFYLDCLGGKVEAIIFHDAFEKYKEIINDGNIVFLVGTSTSQNDFSDLKIIVDEVVPINHAKKVLKLKEVNIKIGKKEKNLMKEEDSLEFLRMEKYLKRSE